MFLSLLSVPEDLSSEEKEELLNIRRRKKELIDDIEVTINVCSGNYLALMYRPRFSKCL